ncbi:hypothetical protein UY3_12653 [Chelonia mydas]|uniref:Uncharacterized protein n=1 Tax=Chelonia mydas TaxID=8469 RepID=M7BDL2_CHEMY|nr:hypothetical protein UY3_12653 [Chelonia mydas]
MGQIQCVLSHCVVTKIIQEKGRRVKLRPNLSSHFPPSHGLFPNWLLPYDQIKVPNAKSPPPPPPVWVAHRKSELLLFAFSPSPVKALKGHQPHCCLKPETSTTSSTSHRLALQGFNRTLGHTDDHISQLALKVPVVSSAIPCGLPKKAFRAEAFWTNVQSEQ